jgi:hypothetical protein
MIGKKELARIHILKKEACLSDEDYRPLLFGAAGVSSAKDIDTADQYYAVIAGLEKYIMSIGRIPSGRTRHRVMTLMEAVEQRARRIMADAYARRMGGYLRKIGKASLSECSQWELRGIMGFLSRIEKAGTVRTG